MQKRYISLDVLRGLTVACMVMVNNPGSYIHRYAPLCHSPWSGCTICDLVFPFFLFCAGVSMAFSLSKYNGFSKEAVRKIVRRGTLIFLLGLLLNLLPFVPIKPHDPSASFGENWIWWITHVRIFGVLQRIGLCYILGGLLALWLKKPARIAFGIVALTVGHWLILRFFGGYPGWDTLEGNISGPIDIAVIGENHVYKGYGIPFDPEGLLGVISGAGTLLLGLLAGKIIRSAGNGYESSTRIFVLSGVCLALGCIWNNFLPINKPLWTGSYVLYTGGWALFLLAFLIYCIDVKGWEKPFTPFKIMGMNPLALFVGIGIIYRVFGMIISWRDADGTSITPLRWYYSHCITPIFGDCEFASLLYALSLVLVMFLFGLLLYRKKIVIRL